MNWFDDTTPDPADGYDDGGSGDDPWYPREAPFVRFRWLGMDILWWMR